MSHNHYLSIKTDKNIRPQGVRFRQVSLYSDSSSEFDSKMIRVDKDVFKFEGYIHLYAKCTSYILGIDTTVTYYCLRDSVSYQICLSNARG